MAIVLRLIQQFQPSKKQEFMDLEKKFANLEDCGLIPRGERLVPIASHEPGNTVIWQCRFDSLAAAEAALKLIEANPEHTELANKQRHCFQNSWVEFYQILDF
jgi:hypothetical protein